MTVHVKIRHVEASQRVVSENIRHINMTLPKTILFATSNPHKLQEVSEILAPLGLSVVGLGSLKHAIAEPVEDQPDFSGNAILKARWYARHAECLAMADDSGLVVDALGGAPGVHSARYSGVAGPRSVVDPANNAKLLDNLRGVPDAQRTARFVCVLAVCDPQRTWALTRGTVEGRIIHEARGSNGFGYDPLFFVEEMGCTTAELSSEAKHAISHRGRATRAMVEVLRQLGL
jgi:XTP/dITP diphosphohydrolase